MVATAATGETTDDATWRTALARVLDDPATIRIVVQPIADIQNATIVGFEALSRFTGPPDTSPDHWFAAAERLGFGARLTAATLSAALARIPELPANTFLTVNLEPGHAFDPDVRTALAAPGRLDRVIVEITEHAAIEDLDAIRTELAALRSLGARVAIDDAGAGHSGLGVLLALRPDLVKLDRGLITDIHHDPVKRVLLRALGELASSIDAWVLAEGIESVGELEELVALEVPLGQGYLLGRPDPAFVTELPPMVGDAIQTRHQRAQHTELAASIQVEVEFAERDAAPSRDRPRVVVDDLRRPIGYDPGDGTRVTELLLAKPSERLTTLARRVSARHDATWHHPVVITDGTGAAVAVVTVPRLLDTLTREPG